MRSLLHHLSLRTKTMLIAGLALVMAAVPTVLHVQQSLSAWPMPSRA